MQTTLTDTVENSNRRATVVGAGPNGLAAAIVLAQAEKLSGEITAVADASDAGFPALSGADPRAIPPDVAFLLA